MAKDARMHIRISAELKQYANDYADRHNTTASALVMRFFDNLREKERRDTEPEDAESI